MDQFQRSFYGFKFRIAFLEKRGTEFQTWFETLARLAYGTDFELVRPYGRTGDLKCDGFLRSEGTVFQCYAPDSMKQARLVQKINEDFIGARKHWQSHLSRWVFVHNARRGLPPYALQRILDLHRENEDIVLETWGEQELRELKSKLNRDQLESLFGSCPTNMEADSVGIDDLLPVIEELEKLEPVWGEEPLEPPSAKKLEHNALFDDARVLLQWGRRKEMLVKRYFERSARPDLGERIAEAFRKRYSSQRDSGLSPDEILAALQACAGGNNVDTPRRQGAVLAVLSYFFERCDIFEDNGGGQ